MKILKVIHGYPMRYNAGSEVYSQTLCHGLVAREHEVHVFTREEDPFAPDYAMRLEVDQDNPRVQIHLLNMPRTRDRYRHSGCDQRFAELLDQYQPDIIHVGHLNHLSTSLLLEAAVREIPIIYTLHDYWVMCPRGQFMQMHPEDPDNLWAACDGQEDRKCAERCYARYFSGSPDEYEEDIAFWTRWVARRMTHLRKMTELVDTFIAPAKYLYQRYQNDFGLPKQKLRYLDYGFDLKRLTGRKRQADEPFTFGYIGTHIPAKGIHHLLQAFGKLEGRPFLRIWGRPRAQNTDALKAIAESLPGDAAHRVQWMGEYKNQEIVQDVFNRVDTIMVPSVWVENSPLVIHEAQQVRVPVITADTGGMAEYVHHEVNGLQFRHRDVSSMAAQMQRFVDNPTWAAQLGSRGYLYTKSGNIPTVEAHIDAIEAIYDEALQRQASAHIKPRKGPWRITFDTNPDTCNLKCIMCEEHSPYSSLQKARKAAGKPRRVMPIEMLRQVLIDSRGTGLQEIIPSTMGEPLLYDDFEEILRLCKQEEVKLNLTTNGTFPRLGPQRWAELIVPVTSDVKISWNGATKETQEHIMLGAQWEKVLDNVKTFIRVRDQHAAAGGNRCRVTFQLTFLDNNVHELADIIKLAAELGVDRVKGHHLWAHFDEIKNLSMRRDTAAITRWNQAVLQAREAAQAHRLPNGKIVLLENIFLLDENATQDLAPGGICPFLGQEAWVSAKGRFDPCCAPDKQRRTLGEFGDLQAQSIREIWQGDRYQQLISSYRTHSLCLACNMRTPVEEL